MYCVTVLSWAGDSDMCCMGDGNLGCVSDSELCSVGHHILCYVDDDGMFLFRWQYSG